MSILNNINKNKFNNQLSHHPIIVNETVYHFTEFKFDESIGNELNVVNLNLFNYNKKNFF